MQEGARVGPYVLGPLLAEGGMARVHAATSVESGARVALKLPSIPSTGLSDLTLDMVRHEVQAMARLSHPHIVPVLDWGSASDGQLYLAMPLVEDGSLRRVASGLDDAGLFALVDQLLDALAYAHDRGVVHRDVKARNLLVSGGESGRPHLWLTDFGIASLDGGRHLADTHGAVGTPTYMAPEQLRGDSEIGPHTDLHAIGVLLFLLFEGRRPFHGSTVEEVLASRAQAPRPRFTERAIRAVPHGLEPIVHRLLDADPLARYPSAGALRAALATLRPSSVSLLSADGVCLECGEPLRGGAPFCAVCETGVPTRVDTDPTSASLATHEARPVTVLAVRTAEAHREAVLSLLERAGALVRWSADGLAVAALGLRSSSGGELGEAAELALALGSLGTTSVGVAPGVARLASGSVLELGAEAAVALVEAAGPGEVRAPSALRDALATSHRIDVHGHDIRIHAALAPSARRMSDARLAALLEAARDVRASGSATAITLTAAAGMGRTLALDTLVDQLEAEGWACLSAGGSEGDEAEPLGAFRAAVRGLFGVWPGASRAAAAEEIDARLHDPALAAAVSAALADAAILEPGTRARSLDALGGLVVALAETAPVLLALDDLASIDATSRELASLLLERASTRPLLIVASARAGDPILAGSTEASLPPLDELDAQALLEGIVRRDEHARMLRLAGGHPLRLLELARLRRQQSELSGDASFDDIAHARLGALGPEERAVVELAAVAGRRFWLPQLFALSALAPVTQLGERVLRLVADGIFTVEERSSIAGARELRFEREATWQIARATIPDDRARRLHARAAAWLEQSAGHLGGALLETIAQHWHASGQLDRAAAWEVRSGRRAEALGAVHDSLERYQRALARLDRDGPVRSSLRGGDGNPLPVDVPGLLVAIARVGVTSGELDVARRAAERALAIEEPPRALVQGQARAALAEIARMEGKPEAALAFIDAALTSLGPSGDRILRAQLLGRRGWIRGYVLGRNDEGRLDGEEALRLLDGLEVPAIESHVYSELGANELRAGRWDRQLECNLRALALSRQAGELTGQVRAHINLSVCFTNRGRLAEAAEHAVSAASMALRTGVHRSRIVAINNLGMIRLDQGELGEARRLLELAIELSARHGIRDALYETLPTLARVLLATGEREMALARIAEGAAVSESEGNPVGIALAARVEALAHARAGELAQASRCLEHADAALGAGGDAYERAITRLTRALLEGGDVSPMLDPLRALGADPDLEIRRWSIR